MLCEMRNIYWFYNELYLFVLFWVLCLHYRHFRVVYTLLSKTIFKLLLLTNIIWIYIFLTLFYAYGLNILHTRSTKCVINNVQNNITI